MKIQELLHYQFFDNNILQYLSFFALLILAILLKKYISRAIGFITYRPFRKFTEENEVKQFVALLLKPLELFIIFLTLYFAFKMLHYPTILEAANEEVDLKILLQQSMKLFGAISLTWIALRLVDFLAIVFHIKYSHEDSKIDEQIIPYAKDTAKVLVCIISFLAILGLVFKLNVLSILAGIGIGGLVFALAAKESVENLFGSFTIFLDKPFTVGDLVSVGKITGTVEKIGFRSTRILTDLKTFVTVPNKQLVDGFLDNMTLRTHRKSEMKLFFHNSCSIDQIRKFLNQTQLLIEQKSAEEVVVVFNSFSNNMIEINVSYLVAAIGLSEFLSKKQEINFGILKILDENQIKLAAPYPQQIEPQTTVS